MALTFKENPSKVVLLSGKSPAYLGRVPGHISVSVMDNLDIKKYLDVRVQFSALPKTKHCIEHHYVHLRSHYYYSPDKKDDLKHMVQCTVLWFCTDYGIEIRDNLDFRNCVRYNDNFWNYLHERGY